MKLLFNLPRSTLVQMMLNHLHVRTPQQCSSTEFLERRESIHGGSPETSLFQSVLELCTGSRLYRYAHAG